MPNTTLQGYPYPALSDAANGPAAVQSLAQALENTTVYTVASADSLPPHQQGRVAYRTDTGTLFISNGTTWREYKPYADSTPPGMISPYAGANAPTGWVICSGGALSRTTYAALFSVIGTTYGAGDGSTTFNVPDLRGRFPIGVHSVFATWANTLGQTEGTSGAPDREARMDHRHSHTIQPANMGVASNTTTGGTANRLNSGETHDHQGATGNSGLSNDTANRVHAYLALNFIIHL